ncbi:MAG: ribosomal protein L7/L12 [Bacteroidota bacterium]
MELPAQAIASLEKGNKIEAIKIVRNAHHLDLKDSKDLVEHYLRDNPSLEQRYSAIQSENNRNAFMKFLFILVVGSAIVYFVLQKM